MTKKKIQTHETLTGEVLEYPEPSPEVAAFLDRVVALANDPRVTHDELVGLIYGPDNPILDQTMFEGKGAVTREVFANPLYHFLLDWLGRKREQAGQLDMHSAQDEASLTVAEAAAELGISSSAVRQAIHAHRLPAIKKGRSWMLAPADVAAYDTAPRGPQAGPRLKVKFGSIKGKSFRVKIPGLEVTSKKDGISEGVVENFREGAVAFSGERNNRMFVIEPSEAQNEFTWGPFYIRGRYRVTEKVNRAGEASHRFSHFVPRRTKEDRDHRRAVLLELAADFGQDEGTLQAIRDWDGDGLSIVRDFGDNPDDHQHLDLRYWEGGDLTTTQAKALKRKLRAAGVDFGSARLANEFELVRNRIPDNE